MRRALDAFLTKDFGLLSTFLQQPRWTSDPTCPSGVRCRHSEPASQAKSSLNRNRRSLTRQYVIRLTIIVSVFGHSVRSLANLFR